MDEHAFLKGRKFANPSVQISGRISGFCTLFSAPGKRMYKDEGDDDIKAMKDKNKRMRRNQNNSLCSGLGNLEKANGQ